MPAGSVSAVSSDLLPNYGPIYYTMNSYKIHDVGTSTADMRKNKVLWPLTG